MRYRRYKTTLNRDGSRTVIRYGIWHDALWAPMGRTVWQVFLLTLAVGAMVWPLMAVTSASRHPAWWLWVLAAVAEAAWLGVLGLGGAGRRRRNLNRQPQR